jgi:hypothetical protein
MSHASAATAPPRKDFDSPSLPFHALEVSMKTRSSFKSATVTSEKNRNSWGAVVVR